MAYKGFNCWLWNNSSLINYFSDKNFPITLKVNYKFCTWIPLHMYDKNNNKNSTIQPCSDYTLYTQLHSSLFHFEINTDTFSGLFQHSLKMVSPKAASHCTRNMDLVPIMFWNYLKSQTSMNFKVSNMSEWYFKGLLMSGEDMFPILMLFTCRSLYL